MLMRLKEPSDAFKQVLMVRYKKDKVEFIQEALQNHCLQLKKELGLVPENLKAERLR